MPTPPTLLVKYAEADDAYLSWRWLSDDGPSDYIGVAQIDAEVVETVDATLRQSVPDRLPGESIADGIDRALTSGAFADPDRTVAIMAEIGAALLPADLVEALHVPFNSTARADRPRIRIQPSPSLTRVPWEMLTVDGVALDDIADVVGGAPATVRSPGPVGSGEGPVVAIIDPKIPGYSASSELGSVLGRPTPQSPLAALLARHDNLRPHVADYLDLPRRSDVDREWLRDNLVGASRLLYVGHVSAANDPDAESVLAALHLACRDGSGAHRPLTAYDMLSSGLTMPPTVALIGCNSGGDLAHPDGMGLTMATLSAGASIVTSTRWAVPTNRALARDTDLDGRSPLEELILAVDDASAAPDVAADLGAWQRRRRGEWMRHGHRADSPLLWAALTTTMR